MLSHVELKISEVSGVFLCLLINILGIPSHNILDLKYLILITLLLLPPPPTYTVTPALAMISSLPPRSFVITMCSLIHPLRITFMHPNQR